MPEFYDSFRDSPQVPVGWRARRPPGALVKVNIHNVELLRFIRSQFPGRWMKVYHFGANGDRVHYCQHESGKVFDVEFHPK